MTLETKTNLDDPSQRTKWIDQVAFHVNSRNWHEVGGTNEPAYANSWTTTTSKHFGFRLIPSINSVQIHGRITPGTETNGTTIFTLPTGYRPTSQLYSYNLATDVVGGAGGRMEIAITGDVTVQDLDTGGTYYDINITFPLDV